MTKDAYKWRRVNDWPAVSPVEWLGIEMDMLDQVRNRYDMGYVFERLSPGPRSNATEVRIPCVLGEIYPPKPGWWAWAGAPKNRYSQICAAAGPLACGVFGNPLPARIPRGDEVVVCFPDCQLDQVALVVKSRRRNKHWNGYRFGIDRQLLVDPPPI